ncbi:MAG TPA: RNA polymerase sigma factor, partial [Isosphaeraceae bacterium]|nr:RNA polymerase sigma factor [Isosphaeraceae bacterium]
MSVEGSNVSLRQLFEVGTVAGLTDAQLLQRFLTRRDEAAFEALVRKLGPMVLAVCRRRLSDPNDVDDAFQATFLVLIRRAPEIQDPGRLANWVYGVAHKVAERARVHALRRREHERKVPPMSAEPDPTPEVDDFAAPLHEEIRALPDRYRSAIVVCFLQGRTHEEAARDLGWPVGTVKGRLARAKDLLRKRLVRRGFTAPAGLLASTLAKDAAGSVPPALLHSTIRAALPFVAGEALTAAAVSTSAAALAQEVARTMIRHHVTLLVLGVAAFGLIGGGAGVYAWQTSGKGDKPSASDNTNPSQPPVAKDSKPPTPEITNEQRAAAAIEVMDAKSRLARARTKFLLSEYKRLKAYILRPFYLASWVVQAGDDTTGAKLKDTLTQIKEVGENPADQIAAVKSLLKTIDDYETQAREALPAGANPNLIDFDIDRAEAEVW